MTVTSVERTRERWRYSPSPYANRVGTVRRDRLIVPPDVERVVTSVPCPNCGVRDGCKHRPWLFTEVQLLEMAGRVAA